MTTNRRQINQVRSNILSELLSAVFVEEVDGDLVCVEAARVRWETPQQARREPLVQVPRQSSLLPRQVSHDLRHPSQSRFEFFRHVRLNAGAHGVDRKHDEPGTDSAAATGHEKSERVDVVRRAVGRNECPFHRLVRQEVNAF